MRNQIKLKRFAPIALTVALVIAMSVQVAFATDPKAGFQDGIMVAYGYLRDIAIGGGAIALAGCGFVMLMGSEKDAEKAKSAIKYIIIAVVGVLILPLVVSAGKTLFGATWDPHSLG